MKKIVAFFIGLALWSCTVKETPADGFAAFLGTRADAPLESTIWEHQTGEKYNEYIVFQNDLASVFFGLNDGTEIQRWSQFFTAPYAFENGQIRTNVVYRYCGQYVADGNFDVIRVESAYEISANGKVFKFVGTDTQQLADMWMMITVTIQPWDENY